MAGNIALGNCLTVLAGVATFVLGQAILKFVFQPMSEQRTVIGEVLDSVVFYANLYANPGIVSRTKMDEAHDALRRSSSKLRARTHAIPWYRLWELLRLVPKRKNLTEVSKELITLSWGVYPPSGSQHLGVKGVLNTEARDRIYKLLGVKIE